MMGTCCNAAMSPLGQLQPIRMFTRRPAVLLNSAPDFANPTSAGMCQKKTFGRLRANTPVSEC
jgi:hypothetical protein